MVYVHEGMNFESLRSTAKASGVLLRGGVSVAQFHTFLNFLNGLMLPLYSWEKEHMFLLLENNYVTLNLVFESL